MSKKPALMIFVVLCGFMAASMPSGQLIGHCIQDGDSFVRVVEQLLDLCQAAAVLELRNCKDLSRRMRSDRHVSRQPEKCCCSVQVFPDRLSGAVLPLIGAVLKHIDAASLRGQCIPECQRKIDPASFAGLLFFDREALPVELLGAQPEHITDAQPGGQARFDCQPVGGHQCREYVFKGILFEPVCARVSLPFCQNVKCKLMFNRTNVRL